MKCIYFLIVLSIAVSAYAQDTIVWQKRVMNEPFRLTASPSGRFIIATKQTLFANTQKTEPNIQTLIIDTRTEDTLHCPDSTCATITLGDKYLFIAKYLRWFSPLKVQITRYDLSTNDGLKGATQHPLDSTSFPVIGDRDLQIDNNPYDSTLYIRTGGFTNLGPGLGFYGGLYKIDALLTKYKVLYSKQSSDTRITAMSFNKQGLSSFTWQVGVWSFQGGNVRDGSGSFINNKKDSIIKEMTYTGKLVPDDSYQITPSHLEDWSNGVQTELPKKLYAYIVPLNFRTVAITKPDSSVLYIQDIIDTGTYRKIYSSQSSIRDIIYIESESMIIVSNDSGNVVAIRIDKRMNTDTYKDFTTTAERLDMYYPITFVPHIATEKTITQTTWNFGDGDTSTALYPIHTYTKPGVYTVTLIIGYSDSSRDTVIKQQLFNFKPIAKEVRWIDYTSTQKIHDLQFSADEKYLIVARDSVLQFIETDNGLVRDSVTHTLLFGGFWRFREHIFSILVQSLNTFILRTGDSEILYKYNTKSNKLDSITDVVLPLCKYVPGPNELEYIFSTKVIHLTKNKFFLYKNESWYIPPGIYPSQFQRPCSRVYIASTTNYILLDTNRDYILNIASSQASQLYCTNTPKGTFEVRSSVTDSVVSTIQTTDTTTLAFTPNGSHILTQRRLYNARDVSQSLPVNTDSAQYVIPIDSNQAMLVYSRPRVVPYLKNFISNSVRYTFGTIPFAISKCIISPSGSFMATTDGNRIVLWNIPDSVRNKINNIDTTIRGIAVKDITIYPNPSSDIVNIELRDTVGYDRTVDIYSSLGQKIKTLTLKAGVNKIHWQVKSQEESLPSSMYYIAVQSSSGQRYVVPVMITY